MPSSQQLESKPMMVQGQLSWQLSSDLVLAHVTQTGGQVGPVTFQVNGKPIQPYSIAPWAEETPDFDLPPMIAALRGDFFCLPFGNGTETPYQGEVHPYHGETANRDWKFESSTSENGRHQLHVSMDTQIRAGRVDKYISLIDKQTAVYSQHVISGMSGDMVPGHHAMLKFPNVAGSGVISTSPFVYGQVLPFPTEEPTKKGYSLLKPGAVFDTLTKVPTITGEITDLTIYPARRGYDDLALIVSDVNVPFAWTAVTFADQGYVWFALKDPNVLRHTMFWISNSGRYYAPWNGRHLNVMGLEEITSYFHCGLAASSAPNPLSELGYPTVVKLDAAHPLSVNYIMAVAHIPEGFDRVAEIVANAAGDAVTLKSASGHEMTTPLDVNFLWKLIPSPK